MESYTCTAAFAPPTTTNTTIPRLPLHPHVTSELGFPRPMVSGSACSLLLPHVTVVFALPKVKLSSPSFPALPPCALRLQMTSVLGGPSCTSSGFGSPAVRLPHVTSELGLPRSMVEGGLVMPKVWGWGVDGLVWGEDGQRG